MSVAADRVRQILPRLIAAGPRLGIELGFSLDPLVDPPTISEIAADGPAAKLDLRCGDAIIAAHGQPLLFSHSLALALVDKKPGDTLELTVRRESETHSVALELAPHASPQPIADPSSLRAGLRYTTFEFEPSENVSSLSEAFEVGKIATSGVINGLNIEAVRPRRENFAIRFEGYLKIDTPGLYALSLTSDDGSRLYLGDRLLVDNDGNHPPLTEASVVRLQKGAYAIRLEYYQGRGDAELSIAAQRDGEPQESIPNIALARDDES